MDEPSVRDIQVLLAENGATRNSSFVGSSDWLGSEDISILVDILFEQQCRIVSLRSGSEARSKEFIQKICDHFDSGGGPVMIGGTVDGRSRVILGISVSNSGSKCEAQYLIADPHFWMNKSADERLRSAKEQGYIAWQGAQDFLPGSWYNLCCPQKPVFLPSQNRKVTKTEVNPDSFGITVEESGVGVQDRGDTISVIDSGFSAN
eukprot:m.92697 g.92697  ORF g.92697 m.92697 type:complete len:205 (-) comp13361_c0_seq1:173-787(-)